MKKHLFKRMLVILLAVAMVLPTLAATSVTVMAEEIDDPYFDPYDDPDPEPDPEPAPEPAPAPDPTPDPTPEPDPEPYIEPISEPIPAPEPTPEPTPEPIIKPVVVVKSSPSEASFGTVNVGESATVTVKVTAGGTVGFNLVWYEVENDDFFSISAPQTTTLMPGDTVKFVLSLKAVGVGSYAGSISFVATDAAGNQDTASTRVTATVKGVTPKVDSVSVNPKSVSLNKGGSAQFAATVKGSNLPTTDVTWSVKDNTSSNTSINSNGYLVVGSDEKSSAVTVVASANADPSKAGYASVSVQSEKKTYYVSVLSEEGGTASGGGTVTEGSSCTVYASPSGGYAFKGWYDENNNFVSNKKNFTIANVRSDMVLVAEFNRCSARVITNSSPDEGGFTKGDGTYNVGSKVTVKASPANGYRFVGWKYNGKVVSKEKEFTLVNVNGEYRLTALFEKNRFNVKVEVSPAGAGAIDGACAYDPGSNATLKAYAAQGYNFKGWYMNCQLLSSDTKYTISKINCDYCITALFEKPGTSACLMTSSAGKGGTITPAVSAPVPAGTNVTYVITPSAGYYIAGLKVDGTAIAAAPTYTFTNVQTNHTIEASFAKKDESKGSKTSDNSKVATGKSVEEAQKEVAAVLSDETKKEEARQELAETKLNTDMDTLTGVLQEFNMTPEEAYLHFNDAVGEELFTEAYKEGMINVVVNNDYDAEGKTSRLNEENYESLTPAISNLEEVYDTVVTDTEALGTLEGKSMEIHWDITNTTGITPQDELDALAKVAKEQNLAIDNTFDITILKTYDGATSIISDTGIKSEITLKVPESLKAQGGQYKILHIHDGEVEVLDNLSNDPNFVKFMADKFSTFAMAYSANGFGEAGKVTGNEAMIYVDTVNDAPSAAKAAKGISPIVIILIVVIVICIALVVVVISLTAGKSKKVAVKPQARPRE